MSLSVWAGVTAGEGRHGVKLILATNIPRNRITKRGGHRPGNCENYISNPCSEPREREGVCEHIGKTVTRIAIYYISS